MNLAPSQERVVRVLAVRRRLRQVVVGAVLVQHRFVEAGGDALKDRIGIVDARAFITGKAEDLLLFADGPAEVRSELGC